MDVNRSLPDLLRTLVNDTMTLIRQEIGLARAELGQKAGALATAAGFFGAAALLSIGILGALTATLIAAGALAMPIWISALLVAAVFAGCALVAVARGKAGLKKWSTPVHYNAMTSIGPDPRRATTGVAACR